VTCGDRQDDADDDRCGAGPTPCLFGCSSAYLEFGTGGSTVLASSLVKQTIVSIDSSKDWIQKVERACMGAPSARVRPHIEHIDIGPVGGFGYPVGEQHRANWPCYHTQIWTGRNCPLFDLCLIDGRFRVACFIQALLHCSPETTILVHDFSSRPHYHDIRLFARELARVELSYRPFGGITTLNPNGRMRFSSGTATTR